MAARALILLLATWWTLVACDSSSDSPSNSGEDGASQSPEGRQGETAVWRLARTEELSSSTTKFTAHVTRLECANGVTGEVLPPEIEVKDTAVTVTFSVATSNPMAANCQANDWVPVQVQLPEPLGERPLLDGACDGEAAGTSLCRRDDARYRP